MNHLVDNGCGRDYQDSWRIPEGFLVVLPGRPGIFQEYVQECKELDISFVRTFQIHEVSVQLSLGECALLSALLLNKVPLIHPLGNPFCIVFTGPVYGTKKKTKTGLDWTN